MGVEFVVFDLGFEVEIEVVDYLWMIIVLFDWGVDCGVYGWFFLKYDVFMIGVI